MQLRSHGFLAVTAAMMFMACGPQREKANNAFKKMAGVRADSDSGLMNGIDLNFDSIAKTDGVNCTRFDDGHVSIRREWPVEVSGSGWRTDTFYSGRYFGRNSRTKPNIGFSSRNGQIVNGAPISHQPRSLTCSPGRWAAVGWQFSNNVAELRDSVALDMKLIRKKSRTGEQVIVRVKGNREVTYFDPASVSPAPDRAYFDESYRDGDGHVIVSRQTVFGSRRAPNFITENVNDRVFSIYSEDGAPVVETLERNLANHWQYDSRTLHSGSLIGSFQNGTTTRTTLRNMVYKRNRDGLMSCRPVSGSMTTHIYPSAPTRRNSVVKIVTHFDSDATEQVQCLTADAIGCRNQAREAKSRYALSTCFY